MLEEKHPPLDGDIRKKLDEILAAHEHDATQIVDILLDAQALSTQHYVSPPVAAYISEMLPIKLALIYDCLTFYDALSEVPKALYPIEVCSSAVCFVEDNHEVPLGDVLSDILGIGFGESTKDGRFSLRQVACFGACDIAPALRINGKVYGHLTSREKIQSIITPLA
ncbi:NADH-quinone oxidoreductase subunit NuoE [Selenomonas sp. TAMA-11512]|uniref:NADH-quinone oxidoreductase subunit NuoE family protein n=1 Tax=Selenomonas sp. TAMA-11512 TaxID=3095337 RepID=UPI003093AEAE|nr:NADH-quinone oxidoreductase subunit NuoE [Selenomonas sp. TAMA-11512]